MTFNRFDDKFQVNRVGIKSYKVKDGLPLNPRGRTGIYGRGDLFFWGPNHCIQNIFISSNSNRILVAKSNESETKNKSVSFPLVNCYFNSEYHI